MAKNNNLQSIRIDKKLKYKEEHNHYSLQLCHVHRPWWLLFLLLPLLLFIKCSKDITVSCVEPIGELPVENIPVTMEYQSHFLWNDGKFFTSDTIRLIQHTDSLGKTVFKDLPCSVFSYVFYCLQKVSFTAVDDCHVALDERRNFHYRWHITLDMEPRLEDLHVQLLDKETGDILPDGILIYKYIELGEEKTDSAHADAAGIATLSQMRYCSVMTELKGTCYGYADTMYVDIPCQSLLNTNDSTALRLRPIKERFTFFVKNKETKQPIPDALCKVSLTHPGKSKHVEKREVGTSIDGQGLAVYDKAFILSTMAITASKQHYKDGQLEGGPWTVEVFNRQNDSIRTIWLEPEPYLEEFVNIDSITGKPIPGVTNVIKVIDHDGTVTETTEMSNSNGVFPVWAKEDAKVEVFSTKAPSYKKKISIYPKYKDIKEEEKKIKMQPVLETLKFRTVREEKPNVLLPKCTLTITGSESGLLIPTNSGNGEFSVTMRKYEYLSIVASRKGYKTNRTKVQNRDWEYLRVNQERRDIPLKLDLPPCDGGENVPKNGQMYHQRSYSMGQEEGDASITGNFYGEPDRLTIYDGPDTSGRILIGPDRSVINNFWIPFHFTQGAITVVIKTSPYKNSSWEYVVNCPK